MAPIFGAPIFGAIDLGTNNCRLMLGVPSSNGFRVIESFSRSVGLGEGLAETGQLAEPAMDRAMDALKSCATRISRYRLSGLTAVATEACRRAVNGPDFLARVRQQTGLDIRIISGREEAELTLESCSPLLRGAGTRALVFDIGGGSTEIAWVRLEGGVPTLISFLSLPFGVMTLGACTRNSCFTEKGFDAMVETVEERLWEFEDIHRIGREINRAGVRLLGTSGTITTVASVALKLPRYRRPLVDGILLPGEEADAAVETFASDGARRARGASVHRRGPRGSRAAGLRYLRGDPLGLADAGGRRRRSWLARGDASAADPGRTPPGAPLVWAACGIVCGGLARRLIKPRDEEHRQP